MRLDTIFVKTRLCNSPSFSKTKNQMTGFIAGSGVRNILTYGISMDCFVPRKDGGVYCFLVGATLAVAPVAPYIRRPRLFGRPQGSPLRGFPGCVVPVLGGMFDRPCEERSHPVKCNPRSRQFAVSVYLYAPLNTRIAIDSVDSAISARARRFSCREKPFTAVFRISPAGENPLQSCFAVPPQRKTLYSRVSQFPRRGKPFAAVFRSSPAGKTPLQSYFAVPFQREMLYIRIPHEQSPDNRKTTSKSQSSLLPPAGTLFSTKKTNINI